MNNPQAIISNVLRFFLLGFAQVLVLKNASDNVPYLEIYLYPLILIMMPFATPHWVLMVIAFILGLFMDAFYNHSYGVHTSVCVLIAFLRPYLADIMQPRGGYDNDQSPSKASLGIGWFSQYAGILLFIHILFYFIFDSLTFSFDLVLRILFSFTVSYLLIILYSYLFNPKH
jgi:hypothetical protein